MAVDSILDALIIGAGFGGIYQLKKLRDDLGLNVKVLEKGSDAGGTWFWNRYPGAKSDTESYLYRYTWDKEDLLTYPWDYTYLEQKDILQYLHHVVDKYHLRKDMQFNTRVLSADWEYDHWRITTSTHEVIRARYLVTALGLLAAAIYPDIPGIDTFQGEKCHTAAWDPSISVKGKRVGVIGCGSTGVQVITALGSEAGQLLSFQRHPQYSVPSGIKPVTPEYRKWVNENYDRFIQEQKESKTCFGVPEVETTFNSVSPEEREAIFQEQWDQGNGFRFMFSTFSDLTTNQEANDAACAFIRKKIAEKVKDPEKARKLTPRDAYARRPLCDHGYYEQFNRDNVDVVDLRDEPLQSITPKGIMTTKGHYDLDVIIFATGFDAVDGSYKEIIFRNGQGETLKEHWAASSAPTSYLGNMVAGFPNLFMVTGPQGPFTNVPPAIEQFVQLNTELIKYTESARSRHGQATLEATKEAEEAWVAHCNDLANSTLFAKTDSWIFGANVQGKKRATRSYMGGMANWIKRKNEVLARDCDGYYLNTGPASSKLRSGT